jgi:superfamily II DNA or RNA helicase
MNLKDLELKRSYDSDADDILNDFYIPALAVATFYNRLAGFFSSSSLAIAARGILGLIENNGTMKIIASPKLNENDLQVMMDAGGNDEKFIEEKLLSELTEIRDDFTRDHVFALGWMLANNKLEIKVAISYDHEGRPISINDAQQSGIFHQKVGILSDIDGNTITFSGSVNETAMGWLGNVEEFKVFRSWELIEEEYLKTDLIKFNNYWSDDCQRLRVIPVPDAVRKRLIEIAPTNIKDINLSRWNIINSSKKKINKLYDYQICAIDNWMNSDEKGIFEMATGTGKTFTALGCLKEIYKKYQETLVVITCPYQHLGQQWKREIDKFGIQYDTMINADAINSSWKNQLTDAITEMSLGYKKRIIIITTHRTFSSTIFKNIIQNTKGKFKTFLIADEVHGLGASNAMTGLISEYVARLGLSATPKRWYDSVGTGAIYDYFGGVVYEFNLDKAINSINTATGRTYLTPFRYIPIFTSLTEEELEEYNKITKTLSKKYNQNKSNIEKLKFIELLIFKRANIIKDAENKLLVLENVLSEINNSMDGTLIYCSTKQIDHVMKALSTKNIHSHRFTMEESTKPEKQYGNISERDFILKMFGANKYKILVAMKCLDEGIDIPSARNTILMASSGNPREYIQRIGRVIRRYPDKSESRIYDIIVIPTLNKLSAELKFLELKILKKELERYEEISKLSINPAESLLKIQEIKTHLED